MNLNKIRLILNISFMLLSLTTVVLYFVLPSDKLELMYVVCIVAIMLKFSESALRMFHNAKNRNKKD